MSNLKIFTKNVEQEAVDQIELLLAQDAFKDCKVRIMPDVHAGKGCVIGFTADLGEKVIPNIVGVDIGCGMLCVSLGQTDIDFEKLDNVIRSYVPSGRDVHEGRTIRFDELQELKDRTVIRIDAINDNDMDESCYFLEDIGEKVFFTREEAETKLKEMES